MVKMIKILKMMNINSLLRSCNKETKLVLRENNQLLVDRKPIRVEEEQLEILINLNHLTKIWRDRLHNKTKMRMKIQYKI